MVLLKQYLTGNRSNKKIWTERRNWNNLSTMKLTELEQGWHCSSSSSWGLITPFIIGWGKIGKMKQMENRIEKMDLYWCCLFKSCFQTHSYHRDLHSFKFHSTSGYRQDCLSICCGLVLLKKLIETSLRVSHSVLRLCGKGFEEEELLLFCGRQALKRWCWWWMGSFWLWWLLKLRQKTTYQLWWLGCFTA